MEEEVKEEEREEKKVRVDWVYIYISSHWRDFMKTVMKFQIPHQDKNSFTR
jgi:hypothetical protein